MKRVLTFDYGATSGRAILCTYNNGKIDVKELHRFENNPVEVNGILYWDVLRLFHELKTGIIKAKLSGGFDCIGIDTWGVDFALIDGDGNMLANPVHYRDKGTDNMMEEVFKIVPREEIYEKTGIQFMQFNTIFQLMHLKNYRPELYGRAKKFIMMPDLLSYFLTGKQYCERTIASTSQLVDPRTGEWCYELIDKLGLKRDIFPEIIEGGTIIGNLSDAICTELNVQAVPVCAVCGHDTASAVVSVPTTETAPAYISCGTWSLLGTELSSPIFTDEGYTNELGYKKSVRYLKNIMGLWIINECKRTWDKEGQVYPYSKIAEMAEKEKGNQFIFDVNDDDFIYPGNMPKAVCNWFIKRGKPAPEGIWQIARSIYDSIAHFYNIALTRLFDITGKKSALYLIGGGCNAEILCQLTATACNIKVYAGPSEATVYGNAAVQLLALGEIKDLASARAVIRASVDLKEYNP